MKEQKEDLDEVREENLQLERKRQQLDSIVQRHRYVQQLDTTIQQNRQSRIPESSISLDRPTSMSDVKAEEALATAAKLEVEKEVAAKVGSISDDDSSDDDSDEDEVERHYDSVFSFSSEAELSMVSDSDEEEAKTLVAKKEENSDDASSSDDSNNEEELHCQNHRKIQALEEEITEVEESLDVLREQRDQDEADLGKCRQAEEVPCLHTKPPRRLLGSVEPKHGTAGRGGDQCKSCGSRGADRGGSCGAPGDRGSRCAQGRGGSGGGRSAQLTTTKCDRTVLRLVWLTRQ
jgi:hypothetical protein